MTRDHNNMKKGLLTISASLLLAASLPVLADTYTTYHDDNTPRYVPVSKPSSVQMRRDDIASLRAQGIRVIRLGQTYRLVIPSDHLFKYDSANLRYSAHRKLNTVARLLNAYHIVTVGVTAYSDSVHAGKRKQALTARQAAVVQAYLSDRGLKARLVYSNGQGEKHPIAWNGAWAGRYANRRVEITFMYIPTTTIYEAR
ncbi:MAG: OmpA family protein [Coxiellaceae bacterium]|nr:OmpA family protein [Coxiellaceae bacterium]